ncbi:hypothetical protein LXL04_024830 [Taraxacum kok-saghyz]
MQSSQPPSYHAASIEDGALFNKAYESSNAPLHHSLSLRSTGAPFHMCGLLRLSKQRPQAIALFLTKTLQRRDTLRTSLDMIAKLFEESTHNYSLQSTCSVEMILIR